MLDEVLAKLGAMEPAAKQALIKEVEKAGLVWAANYGPQTQAYYCLADILLYGGEGGGGKTDLLLGLGFNAHQRSLVMRRKYADLGAILERAIEINGTRKGVNRAPPPKIRTPQGRLVEFGAAQHVGDEQSWQGQPHDFLGIDEVVQFAESQVRFLQGWVRTTEEGQRTRTVYASNPPVLSQGDWIIGMLRPWLDLTHPNPAKDGELRWYIVDPDGKDMEVDGPEPVEIDGQIYIPHSRTFIRASVRDNPYLAGTEYQSKLDSMQEPWRSAIRDGNFMAVRADQESQVIPAQWVRDAQLRWTPTPPDNLPMTAMGVDVAVSIDDTVLAPRHDWWYAPLVAVPGAETPDASNAVALIVQHRRNGAAVVVDVGGGYGGEIVVRLEENGIASHKFNGAKAGFGRTKDGSLGFANKRAEAWWRFREALDPDQEFGSPVCLPDDPELAADLTAPTFEVKTRGILIESKDDIKTRLGRSPDRGDAVVMAWSEGQNALVGRIMPKGKPQTSAKVGYAHMKRRRK